MIHIMPQEKLLALLISLEKKKNLRELKKYYSTFPRSILPVLKESI